MERNFKSVWLLTAISAYAMSSVPMMMLIGSIIRARLARAEQRATLPIAMMVIGNPCGVDLSRAQRAHQKLTFRLRQDRLRRRCRRPLYHRIQTRP